MWPIWIFMNVIDFLYLPLGSSLIDTLELGSMVHYWIQLMQSHSPKNSPLSLQLWLHTWRHSPICILVSTNLLKYYQILSFMHLWRKLHFYLRILQVIDQWMLWQPRLVSLNCHCQTQSLVSLLGTHHPSWMMSGDQFKSFCVVWLSLFNPRLAWASSPDRSRYSTERPS